MVSIPPKTNNENRWLLIVSYFMISVIHSVCAFGADKKGIDSNSDHAYDVKALTDEWTDTFKLSSFYQKYVAVEGLPIVASEKVSDYALREAAWILQNMLSDNPEIIKIMVTKRAFVAIMAYNEYTTDIPEHKHLEPRVFWDRRARGLGGVPVTCGEENLLCFPNDPYEKENLLIHEFSHCMHSHGIPGIDAKFDEKLKAAYENAKKKNLWPNTYAITDRAEYWAEAVQSWYDDNRENDSMHCYVNTRTELKQYDPDLAQLCKTYLGDGPWRYKKPMLRSADGRSHLAGYDFSTAPTFQWRKEELTDKPRVLIQTAIGDIEVELDALKAPQTTKNFVRYVHEGFYSDGVFFRTVREDNQPDDPVKINVLQAKANPKWEDKTFAPIQLERTCDTGLRHLDGTISMARTGPNTATHHFFICVGDQPALDFGGKRNSDGQGFAAFGHVVEGMDIVRKIHALPADKQILTPPVEIQRAVRRH